MKLQMLIMSLRTNKSVTEKVEQENITKKNENKQVAKSQSVKTI